MFFLQVWIMVFGRLVWARKETLVVVVVVVFSH